MEIYIVDAFAEKAFQGNPAAVCIMESKTTDEYMQQVAAEMNLSETAFLHEKEDGYSLRWFTPEAEVDLCGHATLASAHVLWEEEKLETGEISFFTKSGVLTINKSENWIKMNFPLEVEEESSPPEELVEGLGVDIKYTGKNRLDYLVEAENEAVVKNLNPDFSLLKKVNSRGVIVTSKSERAGIDFVSRCFYPALGVDEDPVTGSAHCCLGPYWKDILNKKELTARQISSRGGILKLTILRERIIIAGQAITTLRGELGD
ncbi:MAG: PhzF family phenazine biosynthesis protein [Bacillota bacterium]